MGEGGQPDRRDESGSFLAPAPMDHSARIESEIQRAIREGLFDDLPGAGKPLRNLDKVHDADWWLKQKIEDENLGGLGPAAIMLRREDAGFQSRLDGMFRAEDVRAAVEDFNRRVVEARRQLQGGPPVVTKTRDADAEVAAWEERRRTRLSGAPSAPQAEGDPERQGWLARRRAHRNAKRSE